MNLPTEFWVALNTLGLFGIAVLGFLSKRSQDAKQESVSKQVSEVKQIVDGPLSLALKSNADLAKKVAELTGDHVDAMVAIKAKALADSREAGKQESPMKPTKP